MYCKQAQIAANWWAEKMKERCSLLYPQKVIVENSNFVIIDNSFKEELSRFQEFLIIEIQHCLETNNYLSLTCCPFPNRDLSLIAKEANISHTYFPLKASMEIICGKIQVSHNGSRSHELSLRVESK